MPPIQMPTLSFPIDAYVINLDRDEERLKLLTQGFVGVDDIKLSRMPGLLASSLPMIVQRRLGLSKVKPDAGALGCFLSHVKVWEAIASQSKWVLVLEDDATLISTTFVRKVSPPDDAEIVFVNHRSEPPPTTGSGDLIQYHPTLSLLRHKANPATKISAPGTDGYLLNPIGASKLIAAVSRDCYHGHVDWRLLRYSLDREQTQKIIAGTWMERVVPLSPEIGSPPWLWNIVKGYCMTPATIKPRAISSTRRNL